MHGTDHEMDAVNCNQAHVLDTLGSFGLLVEYLLHRRLKLVVQGYENEVKRLSYV